MLSHAVLGQDGKPAGDDTIANGGEHVHWHNTWNTYVRGHIVSVTAAELIQSFLLETLAASGGSHDDDAQSEEDKSEEDTDMQPLKLSRTGLKDVLTPPCFAPCAEYGSDEDEKSKTTGA